MKHSKTIKLTLSAMFLALGFVLPFFTGQIPQIGNMLLPMHLPVLLCGLIAGWPFGLLCGLAGPLLSSLLTGMPATAYLPVMMMELALYGLLTGLFMQLIHTGKVYADLYISLVISLLAGRVLAGIARALIFAPGSYSISAWATGYFITCLPGLVIQLALVPTVVFALEKARLIPVRYPVEED